MLIFSLNTRAAALSKLRCNRVQVNKGKRHSYHGLTCGITAVQVQLQDLIRKVNRFVIAFSLKWCFS